MFGWTKANTTRLAKHLTEAQTLLAQASLRPRSRRQDVDLKMSLGWLERDCENLEQAEHWLREAEKQAALAAADAETPPADQQEGLAQLALAQSTLGDVLSQSGRHSEAIECLRRSLQTGEHLVRLAPSHLPYLEELAFAELSLAQALMPLGVASRKMPCCSVRRSVLTSCCSRWRLFRTSARTGRSP